ncbi:MAG: molybdate ABC transporter substrate-binding protein [Proteocatella sp.]
MKRMKKVLVLAAIAVLIFSGCSKVQGGQAASQPEKKTINISAAASLKNVMAEIEEKYENEFAQTDIVFNFGGSGALQTQIEEGAPVDIFFSAGSKQIKELDEKALIKKGSIRTFLGNQIVAIKPRGSEIKIKSIEDLEREDIAKIGYSDPKLAPAGQYASEAITYYHMEEKLSSKTILSSDVKTTLSWAEMGEIDLGFVYSTDAMDNEKVETAFIVDEASHSKIEYPVAIIDSSQNFKEAEAFIEYMETSGTLDIFEKYGFSVKRKE